MESRTVVDDRKLGRPASICFVINSVLGFPPHVGGLSVSAHRITQHLVHAGLQVHVVTMERGAGRDMVSEEGGLTVHRVAARDDFAGVFALPHYLRRLDAKENFAAFHAFFLTSVPPCKSVLRSAADGRMRPLIASIRGSDLVSMLETPRSRPTVLAALAEPTCWVTSVNEEYLAYVERLVDISGRGFVIRNGAPEATRRWQLTDANRATVGTLGEFRKVKDIPLMVRGFVGMAEANRRRLLLVGDFKDQLEAQWSETLLREAGLWERTERTGFLPHSEAMEQLARMHVYVQTSAAEGMPNALLEAAAFGVPIVATAVGGVKEVFTHEQDALLVPHAEPRMLSSALDRMVANPELGMQLATQAARLCEVYSAERERRGWLELYAKVLAGHEATKEEVRPA